MGAIGDDDVFQRMVALRRDLHQHPELSGKEARTATQVAQQLTELGVSFRTGVAGHGIVADIPGQRPGPIVALRGDLDALPIHEETGLDFASEVSGVMHACGHDGHTAMVVGAAALLVRDPAPGPVRLLFQPAEELGLGARAMVEAGVLDDVGLIFGGHLDRHYPVGSLVITDGAVNASTDTFTIDVTGRGGHGARPHEALDAVVIGSLIVTALQTIVSREVDPAHASVVSVGSFHAGNAPNVIAGTARLEGTIRAQDPAVREQLCTSVVRVAKAVGMVHDAEVQAEVQRGTPPVINQREWTALAREAARQVVDEDHILELATANMGGEDFAWFLERVGGCYVRFGAQVPGRENYPAHSSRFDFHEDALRTGARWLAAAAHLGSAHLLA